MKRHVLVALTLGCAALSPVFAAAEETVAVASATSDWPQWRGPNRDARASSFKAPATWPKELTKKWSVDVGDGVASPSLVGNKLYVFALKDGEETIRCLNAETGDELWKDGYKMSGATGAASGFAGPRASPTIADGKVVTFGVRGTLSCLDADSGKELWYNEDYADSWPRFFTSSSPIIVDDLCIAQLGGERGGITAAFDMNTGKERWKWDGDGPSYASPVVLDFDGQKVVVAVTDRFLVALNVADGKELWKTNYSQGRYNASTPIIAGDTIIIAGPSSGITAIKLVKKDGEFATEEQWKNRDNSLIYNTPVVRDGQLYGLSTLNSLFCINTNGDSASTAWNAPFAEAGAAESDAGRSRPAAEEQVQAQEPGQRGPGGPGAGGRGGAGGGRRGGRGGGGYGSVVDAGSVLLALNPTGTLIVFEPNEKEYKQLASYKVAEGSTYAYPIVVGNRIYIKDKDHVTLWTVE